MRYDPDLFCTQCNTEFRCEHKFKCTAPCPLGIMRREAGASHFDIMMDYFSGKRPGPMPPDCWDSVEYVFKNKKRMHAWCKRLNAEIGCKEAFGCNLSCPMKLLFDTEAFYRHSIQKPGEVFKCMMRRNVSDADAAKIIKSIANPKEWPWPNMEAIKESKQSSGGGVVSGDDQKHTGRSSRRHGDSTRIDEADTPTGETTPEGALGTS